jgi:hypothetical protein
VLKKASLLILSNLLFVALAVAIYGIGYEYDKANKLYPESKDVSYDLSMLVYGERWVRFVEVMLGLGIGADAVLLMFWYRNIQKKSLLNDMETKIQ